MKISYHVYIVKDLFGTIDFDVASDSSDTIQICGMKDKDGTPIYFESEAYHLPKWCDENGLQYTDNKRSEDVI